MDYLQLTLIAGEDGRLEYSTTSHWVGFASLKPLIERRVPSVVDPDWFIDHWASLSLPYMIVSTESELYRYLMTGGHALVEKGLAERFLPFIKRSQLCRNHGLCGFLSAEHLPSEARNRVPTRKMRMRVIKRDHWRCVICGRRPADYVDVELHVHHIRPWGDGGATMEDNLVTLCQTCHGGLKPHFEPMLFGATGTAFLSTSEYVVQHLAGVRRYRELAALQYANDRREPDAAGPESNKPSARPKSKKRLRPSGF